jgi:hypothetical protein
LTKSPGRSNPTENPLDWEMDDPATRADINQAIQDAL